MHGLFDIHAVMARWAAFLNETSVNCSAYAVFIDGRGLMVTGGRNSAPQRPSRLTAAGISLQPAKALSAKTLCGRGNISRILSGGDGALSRFCTSAGSTMAPTSKPMVSVIMRRLRCPFILRVARIPQALAPILRARDHSGPRCGVSRLGNHDRLATGEIHASLHAA